MNALFLEIRLLVALGLSHIVFGQGSADRFCAPTINVRKNTSVRGLRKSPLNFSCPVRYCEEIPAVKWFKLDEVNNRIPVNETDLITTTHSQTTEEKLFISYLNFRSVSDHDEGFYRCVASYLGSSSSSHTINLLINGSAVSTHTINYSDDVWNPAPIIMCFGFLGTVTIVVLLSVLSLRSRTSIKDPSLFTTVMFTPEDTAPLHRILDASVLETHPQSISVYTHKN
ncbi:uncharacterized protein [Hoplias malabaricus]|uniref:uncharacterized protein n=1 Tax=Hoplias malabaricus TaxID=27720 RepID=UPI0034621AA8